MIYYIIHYMYIRSQSSGFRLELRQLQAEERSLRRRLRCSARRLERCAALDAALAELEEAVAAAAQDPW